MPGWEKSSLKYWSCEKQKNRCWDVTLFGRTCEIKWSHRLHFPRGRQAMCWDYNLKFNEINIFLQTQFNQKRRFAQKFRINWDKRDFVIINVPFQNNSLGFNLFQVKRVGSPPVVSKMWTSEFFKMSLLGRPVLIIRKLPSCKKSVTLKNVIILPPVVSPWNKNL